MVRIDPFGGCGVAEPPTEERLCAPPDERRAYK